MFAFGQTYAYNKAERIDDILLTQPNWNRTIQISEGVLTYINDRGAGKPWVSRHNIVSSDPPFYTTRKLNGDLLKWKITKDTASVFNLRTGKRLKYFNSKNHRYGKIKKRPLF